MKFAFEREDGTVAIADAAPNDALERSVGPMTTEQYEAYIRARLIPPNAKTVIALPDDWQEPDRAKRNEWRIRAGQVVIDG